MQMVETVHHVQRLPRTAHACRHRQLSCTTPTVLEHPNLRSEHLQFKTACILLI